MMPTKNWFERRPKTPKDDSHRQSDADKNRLLDFDYDCDPEDPDDWLIPKDEESVRF